MEGRWKDSQEMDLGGKRRKTGDAWIVQVFAIRSDGGQGPCVFDDTFDEAHGASNVQPLCCCPLDSNLHEEGRLQDPQWPGMWKEITFYGHPTLEYQLFYFFFLMLVLNCLIKKIHEIISDNWDNPLWPRFSSHLSWNGGTGAHTHTCPGRHTGANILVPRCGLTILICTESLSMSLPSELTQITWVTQDEAKHHLHLLIMIMVLIVL